MNFHTRQKQSPKQMATLRLHFFIAIWLYQFFWSTFRSNSSPRFHAEPSQKKQSGISCCFAVLLAYALRATRFGILKWERMWHRAWKNLLARDSAIEFCVCLRPAWTAKAIAGTYITNVETICIQSTIRVVYVNVRLPLTTSFLIRGLLKLDQLTYSSRRQLLCCLPIVFKK